MYLVLSICEVQCISFTAEGVILCRWETTMWMRLDSSTHLMDSRNPALFNCCVMFPQFRNASTQHWLSYLSSPSSPYYRGVRRVENSWWKQPPLVLQTRPYTVSIYTATVDPPEFKYRCWVWILFFIWKAWIIERERRWGGIHSGDGMSRHKFPTYISSLLNGVVVHFVHKSTSWVWEKFVPKMTCLPLFSWPQSTWCFQVLNKKTGRE